MPRSFAPGATIARPPSGDTATPPPPSVRSATEPVTPPVAGFTRTSRDRGLRFFFAGSVAEIHAWPPRDRDAGGAAQRQPPHEPARVQVQHRDLAAPSAPRRRGSPSPRGRPACPPGGAGRRARDVAMSMTSIPLLRAAYARVPSGETASAAGTPCSAPCRTTGARVEVDHGDDTAGRDQRARAVRRGRDGARRARRRAPRPPRSCGCRSAAPGRCRWRRPPRARGPRARRRGAATEQ